MINPLRILRTGFKQAIQTTKEVREAKKIEKQRLCKVIFIERNNMVSDYIGKLSANSDFLTVENLNRVFMVDSMYWYKSNIPIAFVSTDFHRTISVNELSTINPLSKDLISTNNNTIFKTLNLNEKDDKKSFDFSSDAYVILKSKAFEFLEEVSRRTIYFVFLIALLLGMFLGSVITIVIK